MGGGMRSLAQHGSQTGIYPARTVEIRETMRGKAFIEGSVERTSEISEDLIEILPIVRI